jgi:anthranilate phosphoribosyltransferase
LTTLTPVPRRSKYPGFRAYVKAVGTGQRGRRALEREEACDAMRAIVSREVTDAQAGAFLVAMRIKGETPEELAGFADALRERATPLEARTARPLVACAGGYDGCVDAPALSLAAGVVAAAAGAGVVIHCGSTLGPKHGVTAADVLAELGGPGEPTAAESEAMLEHAGVTLVNAARLLPGWREIAVVRDEVGLRGPIHSAEKLVDWFGARRFVVGYAHSQYAKRLCDALALLGAERAYAVRGPEGTDVLRPGRPTAHLNGEPLDLSESIGERLSDAPGAAASASLTRAVVARQADRVTDQAVVLSAGLRLHACGLAPTVALGASAARAAIADGRAATTLDLLTGG